MLAFTTDALSALPKDTFKREKYDFPILYSNGSGYTAIQYGRWNLTSYNQVAPSVYIIDKDGRIAWQSLGSHIYHQVKNSTVISELQKLQNQS